MNYKEGKLCYIVRKEEILNLRGSRGYNSVRREERKGK